MKTKRTISRESFAYPFFPTALQSCAMRIDPDQDFDEGLSSFLYAFEPAAEPPTVEFRFRVNLSDLARQAHLPQDAIRSAVVVRSDELRLRHVLGEFPGPGIPETWSGRIPMEAMGSKRLEVDLVCYLSRQLDHSYERAWRLGTVFAKRTWSIASPRYASLFQVTWESFSLHEAWEDTALWRVEFPEGERFHEVSAEAAVSVILNADLPGLHAVMELPGRTPAARAAKSIVTRMLFAEMLGTIVHTVLEDYRRFSVEEGWSADDLDEDRLTSRVLRFLEAHGVLEADLRAGRLDGLAAVSHFLQGVLELGAVFGDDTWERLSR